MSERDRQSKYKHCNNFLKQNSKHLALMKRLAHDLLNDNIVELPSKTILLNEAVSAAKVLLECSLVI